jgi:SAM-dependent methyltransferase
VNPLKRLLGPAVHEGRIKAREWRREGNAALEELSVRAAPHLYRQADRLSARPFRHERMARPSGPVLDDLAAYTGLPTTVVEDLVLRREPVDFRAEWHATPPALRDDHWFYLSSKTYLFGNAIHFPDDTEIDAVAELLVGQETVLEFGAGSGNLALGLAERGLTVVADEVSALQRDFIRFRVTRHGLDERLSVLDPWTAPAAASVDAITAFDVLEHLPDGHATLQDRLLPALRPGGVLIENSPFVRNMANPMHHQDWGMDAYLRDRGLALEHTGADGTRVWRSAAA